MHAGIPVGRTHLAIPLAQRVDVTAAAAVDVAFPARFPGQQFRVHVSRRALVHGCPRRSRQLAVLMVCRAIAAASLRFAGKEGVRDISSTRSAAGTIRSAIPARVDRLRWTPFHTRMVVALGVAWILDGLEITIASSVAGDLTSRSTLGLSATAVGAIATVYLAGEVAGALGFGRLSDRLGRKKLFMVTLGVYLGGSALTALTAGNTTAWVAYMFLTRFIAGSGIGGEYAAINSAIDEMIPARYRGRVDIAVNGTYWAGALIGTAAGVPPAPPPCPGPGVAAGLPAGTCPRPRHHRRQAEPAGEPAMAAHARQGRRGRGSDPPHRAAGPGCRAAAGPGG